MIDPFIEKTSSTSGDSSEYTAVPSLRESLMEENPMHIQSMQSGHGRGFAQQSCQTSHSKPCQASSVCQETNVAYQAAMPYPLVKPQCKNPRYAAAILDNMAGQNSEMTAVSFYFYNQIIAEKYKELADTFYHINKVEMHHMNIFGNMAMQLGENPRLWSRRGRGGSYVYWSPAFNKYPAFPLPNPRESDCACPEPVTCPAVKQLLAMAIEGEKDAISKYMHQTTWIQDVNICDNLRRISADEQMHLEILTRLYHKY